MTEAVQKRVTFGLAEGDQTDRGTILVKKVDRFSSLEKAGIAPGDELVTLNGKEITTEHVRAVLDEAGEGGVVQLRRIRDGVEEEIAMKLKAKRVLNLDIDELNDSLERKISP